MKKLISAVLLFTVVTATAQKNLKFSIGAELASATGNLNKVYSLGIGGTAQVDYMITNDVAVTGNAGVIELVGRKISGTNLKYRSTAVIPLLVGIKYYFTPAVYGSGQIGTSVFSSGGGSTFTYAPGVGYKFTNRLDALLKYTGYSSSGGTFGIRLGYTF